MSINRCYLCIIYRAKLTPPQKPVYKYLSYREEQLEKEINQLDETIKSSKRPFNPLDSVY